MSRRTYLPALLLLAATLPGPLAAQDSVLSDPAYDEIILLPSLESARNSIAAATTDARFADELSASVRTERMRTRSQLEIAKSELETVKKRLDLAKKEKNEADMASLGQERTALETRVRLLERWRDVHEAAVRAAESQQAAAESRRKVAEAEIELMEKKEQRAARSADSTGVAAINDELRRSAKRVLELRRDDAERRRQLADRERQVAQQQLDLLAERVKAGR